MNPILLLIGYSAFCLGSLFLYFSGILHRLGLVQWLDEILQERCPSFCMFSGIPRCLRYVAVLCYHLVVLGSHIVGIMDLLPHFYLPQTSTWLNMPALMYHLWIAHTVCYLLCAFTDPGVLNIHNHKSALTLYPYDGRIYRGDQKCSTCQFNKPARSKHCNVCNRCVHRFDHHCLWINCCIGAYNYRYFLGVLITGIVMCCNGVFMSLHFFQHLYEANRLHMYMYIDSNGHKQRLGGLVLAQYLFFEYPRVFILLFSLGLLAILLTVFTCYHLVLVVSNNTTNESYKLDTVDEGSKNSFKKTYNRGVGRNIVEVITPSPLSTDSPALFKLD